MTSPDDGIRRAVDELRRQRRLVDQGLTMQGIGTVLLCAILVLSVIGTAFAFAGPEHLVTIAGLSAAKATWLGWISVGTFALVLVELVLDRRGAAQRHADAVRVLGALKAEYRVLPAAGEEVATAARMSERYAQAMESIPAVPERAFNRLKAAHLRKVEISKLLSEHPGMSPRRAHYIIVRRQKDVR